ncbi:MAG TPA: nicotinate phosphoribosyltransferase [Burkholderiales bacterium]|nr:nicotinate phosphoribosyltransferase [Burkholderiales bacterium]
MLVAAGLEPVLGFLENLHFEADELAWLGRQPGFPPAFIDWLSQLRFEPPELEWLAQQKGFPPAFIDWLATLRFSGEVDAMPEGTPFFADEPILRIVAPLPQAQLVETRVVALLHFCSLIASKAARCVLAAPGKLLVDFGLRRAHGAEAGLLAARSSYLAGFAGSATVLAGQRYGLPIFGTMAHSFVQAHESETAAFLDFARAHPDNTVLLVDTYDTEAGAAKVVALVPRLRAEGIQVRAVRLDSGDLAAHAHKVRRILDDGGCPDIRIFASGGLDEYELAKLAPAPIDGFGVGTALVVSDDAPGLDCAYKLQEYAGLARRKRSEGKSTWPGRKQVFRELRDGRLHHDRLALAGERLEGEPLIAPVMRDGKRLAPAPTLAQLRERALAALESLPAPLRALEPAPTPYRAEVTPALRALADEVDRRQAAVIEADRLR